VEQQVRLTAWANSRYHMNYVTYGYVAPWWDWPEWEKFIDWMALNGVNMPLAITGQEGVWEAVGRRFGMTEREIAAFLPGPPYLPFSWMGCLDGFGGPLPKDWVPRHVELGRKILARERELGMTPVLQGFTGHVPQALAKRFPDARLHPINWLEFSTQMLDPLDPLYPKFAAAFLEEQNKLFGTDHLYAADTFIEMNPPSGDLDFLRDTSRAILKGLTQTDPKAVWLLQGWTFYAQKDYWSQERIKAFLDAVPNDRMLVLDLFCDVHPLWNTTAGFYEKPWVWSFVYNFGDRVQLGSWTAAERFQDLDAARAHPLGRQISGLGLMMEGYGHSPYVFDLMYELAWREKVPELSGWMRDYVASRYGKPSPAAQEAWETLLKSVYSRAFGSGISILSSRPSAQPAYDKYDEEALDRAWERLLQAGKELGATETYRHDLVNVARQALSERAAGIYSRVAAAYAANDPAAYRKASREFLELLQDVDEMLATNDQFLLGAWLHDARRWGRTAEERDRLEWNARRILTVWGTGKYAPLRDYAGKEWAGMLRGFHAERWQRFFESQLAALERQRPFDSEAFESELKKWEDGWADRKDSYPPAEHGDTLQIARKLWQKYRTTSADRRFTMKAHLP
jgi:alpha-N-acetylglucosaminidase